MKINTDKLGFFVNAIRYNRTLRRKVAQWSHPLFNAIYLPRPLELAVPMAPFQREIFKLTEDKSVELCIIAGFRESGKTSICTISFPLWAMLSGQAHFIVIVSQTRPQARAHLANIKRHLESNPLLRNDFGEIEEESDEWGAYAMTSKKLDARIIAVSTETAVRGLLYKHYRPDLIVCDDIEDLSSTKTQESRERIFNWFVSEIIPLGSKHTRIFVLGNFLHEFSLVARLMTQIEAKERDGVARRYPLVDEYGTCLWPGMYPDAASLEAKRRKVGDDATWAREYLLTLISSDDKLVPLSWIHQYNLNDLPPKDDDYLYTWSAVDLAISQNEAADCTAIVSAQVYEKDGQLKIYILPDPINQHFNFPQAIERMKGVLDMHGEKEKTKMFIETNGFQEAFYQVMFQDGYTQVESIKTMHDKRTRLALITKFIKDGTIQFPNRSRELITELIGFGKERHDDLVDALTMLVTAILENHQEGNSFRGWLNWVKKNGSMFIDSGRPAYVPAGGLLPFNYSAPKLCDDSPRRPWWQDEREEHVEPEPDPEPRQRRYSTLDSFESMGRRSDNDPSDATRSSGTAGRGNAVDQLFGGSSERSYDSDSGGHSGRSSGGGSIGGMLGGAASRYLER